MRVFDSSLVDCVPFRAASYYGKHMVLQMAPARAHIWGYGTPGSHVTVSSDGSHVADTMVGGDTKWRVLLPASPAGGPHNLRFHSGNENFYLSDVMFGDVWVCSGQSNMNFQVKQVNTSDRWLGSVVVIQEARISVECISSVSCEMGGFQITRLAFRLSG